MSGGKPGWASALTGIRLVIGPISALPLTAGIIFAILYPLTRKQHRKIVEELRQRRATRQRATKFALGTI